MKFFFLLLMICIFAACDTRQTAVETTKAAPAAQRSDKPVVATEQEVPFFEASGFEPMWSLKLNIGQDGTYPVSFTSVTEEMTGTLKKIGEHIFEGSIKGRSGEKSLRLTITDKPCPHEDGATKDPQTAIITLDGKGYVGCGKKL
jgi:uncharacterized membrane protein